jgi:hypothetical protein
VHYLLGKGDRGFRKGDRCLEKAVRGIINSIKAA